MPNNNALKQDPAREHAALTAALDHATGSLAGPTERLRDLRGRRADASDRLRASSLQRDADTSAEAARELHEIDQDIEKAIASLAAAREGVAGKYAAAIKHQMTDLLPALDVAVRTIDEARERLCIICRHSTTRGLGIPHLVGVMPPTDQIKFLAKRLKS